VEYLQTGYGVSERRACRVLVSARSTQRYRSVADRREALRLRLRELAASRPNWGYRRLTLLLRRQGWSANHKLVYRLYKEEALGLRRRRPRRRVSAARREMAPTPTRCNESWGMDFMSDQLYSGRPIRILTIVDQYSRESLALRAGSRLTGDDVVTVLQGLIQARGIPLRIKVDNGPEFTSKVLDQWAYWNGVTLDFSRPGKPADNGRTEAFNGRLRAECLNEHWFLSVADAQERLDAWRADYNGERPHGALKNQTPNGFAQQAGDGCLKAAPQTRKTRPKRPRSNGRKRLLQATNSH
jgi:putative transposase